MFSLRFYLPGTGCQICAAGGQEQVLSGPQDASSLPGLNCLGGRWQLLWALPEPLPHHLAGVCAFYQSEEGPRTYSLQCRDEYVVLRVTECCIYMCLTGHEDEGCSGHSSPRPSMLIQVLKYAGTLLLWCCYKNNTRSLKRCHPSVKSLSHLIFGIKTVRTDLHLHKFNKRPQHEDAFFVCYTLKYNIVVQWWKVTKYILSISILKGALCSTGEEMFNRRERSSLIDFKTN